MESINKAIKKPSTSFIRKSYAKTITLSSFRSKKGKKLSKMFKIMAKIVVKLSISNKYLKILHLKTLMSLNI